MAILNGVQQIANLLNKDSVLVLKMKQIASAASATTTTGETSALAANTVATTANTASTKLSTIGQNAWNVAKAIGKALLGDFSGLLLVGAGALLTYSLCTDSATDSAKQQNEETERSKEIQKQYHETVADSAGKLMAQYDLLKTSYSKLKTEHERVEWIKKNKTNFQRLGISVNNVSDAEKVFVENTDKVVAALQKRAEIAAAMTVLEQTYAERIKAREKVYNDTRNEKVVTAEDFRTKFGVRANESMGAQIPNKIKGLEWMQEGVHYGYDEKKKGYVVYEAGITEWVVTEGIKLKNEQEADRKRRLDAIEKKYEEDSKRILNDILAKQAELDQLELQIPQLKDPDVIVPDDTDYTKFLDDPKNKAKNAAKNIDDLKRHYTEQAREIANQIQSDWDKGYLAEEDAIKKFDKLNKELREKVGADAEQFNLDNHSGDIATIYNNLKNGASEVKQWFDDGIISAEEYITIIKKINSERKVRIGEDKGNDFELNLEDRIKRELYRSFQSEISDIQFSYEINDIDYTEAIKKAQEVNERMHEILGEQVVDLKISLKDSDISTYGAIEEKYDQLVKKGREVQELFDKGLISAKTALAEIEKINQQIDILGGKRIELEIKANFNQWVDGLIDNNLAEQVIELGMAIKNGLGNAAQYAGASIAILGQQLEQFSSEGTLAKVAAVTAAVGQIILGFASASVQAAELGPLGWLAWTAAGLATVAATIATIQKFADGGIVGGNSFVGDRQLVRVNAGEMILNNRQ